MANYPKNQNQQTNREFVNGIFVTKREGQYGEFFSLGLKKEDVIANLQALEEDDRGFVNLTMTPQKGDPNKYSVYVNSWKPGDNEKKSAPTPAPKQQTPNKSTSKSKAPASTDDLPF